MLPVISLDDERFEEILENARKMIPNLYPEWTDYNYHDPGITMMELLAWLKEVQQFHMDQIGPGHIRRYLALLGETPAGRQPARTLVCACPREEGEILPAGSRFWAYQVPFETEESRYLPPASIAGLVSARPGQLPWEGVLWQTGDRTLQLPMFGNRPEEGCSFCIGFTEPLDPEETHSLYFRLFSDYPVERKPFSDTDLFVPLAAMELEYLHGGTFVPAAETEDETHQFLQDGFFRFRLGQDPETGPDGRYWIRFRLTRAEYDVAPMAEQVSLHELRVRQKHTLCCCEEIRPDGEGRFASEKFLAAEGGYEVYLWEAGGLRRLEETVSRRTERGKTYFSLPEVKGNAVERGLLVCFDPESGEKRLLGTGTGFPYQELEVQLEGLCADGMELLIETEEGSGVFLPWKRAEDFSGSGPEDRVYVFEEETGRLRFGSCDRGMAPEGRILLASGYTSLGAGGNVKAESIGGGACARGQETATNREEASGGADPESLQQCWIRLRRKLKETCRAVSYEDFETLAMETPGLRIEKAKVIPVSERVRQDGSVDELRVTLVAKPYSQDPMPRLSRPYLENILNYLEPRRLIGTRVSVLSPEYIGIIVFAEIETDLYRQKLREEIEAVLREYFERHGSDFGQPVPYGTIYGIIDVMKHVTRVRSISLDARGSGIRRNRNGDILLPVNGLAYLKEWDCMISSAG